MDISREIAAFAGADQPRFVDETAALIRRRMTAVALTLFIVLAAAFVRNLSLPDVPLVALRAAVLLIFASSYFVLRSRVTLSLLQLRCFELVDFGALAVQLLAIMYWRITELALFEVALLWS